MVEQLLVAGADKDATEKVPPLRQPRGKWIVSLVNSHSNTTSQRWHQWEIDLRFALKSTPGWKGAEGMRDADDLRFIIITHLFCSLCFFWLSHKVVRSPKCKSSCHYDLMLGE